MLDHCDKHGPYSAFCRECDLETIEEAMKPTPTTAMIEAGQKALEEAPIEWGQEAETVWLAMEAVRLEAAAPHPTKPQPLAFEDQAYAAYADHSEAGEAIGAFAEYALKPQPEMGERAPPELLSPDEAQKLLTTAEGLWRDLQQNELGGFSGVNRPFYILNEFRRVIERYGHRDTGLTWSKNDLDALATGGNQS